MILLLAKSLKKFGEERQGDSDPISWTNVHKIPRRYKTESQKRKAKIQVISKETIVEET